MIEAPEDRPAPAYGRSAWSWCAGECHCLQLCVTWSLSEAFKQSVLAKYRSVGVAQILAVTPKVAGLWAVNRACDPLHLHVTET
jgi:hypothetical protein